MLFTASNCAGFSSVATQPRQGQSCLLRPAVPRDWGCPTQPALWGSQAGFGAILITPGLGAETRAAGQDGRRVCSTLLASGPDPLTVRSREGTNQVMPTTSSTTFTFRPFTRAPCVDSDPEPWPD